MPLNRLTLLPTPCKVRPLGVYVLTEVTHFFPPAGLFELLKATKLQEVVFRPRSLHAEWTVIILRDITRTRTHSDLRRISVDVAVRSARRPLGDVTEAVEGLLYHQWRDLDLISVDLWESSSIRTNVKWKTGRWQGNVVDHLRSMFPEMIDSEDVGKENWSARGGVCPSGSTKDNDSTPEPPSRSGFHGWIQSGRGEGCWAGAHSRCCR